MRALAGGSSTVAAAAAAVKSVVAILRDAKRLLSLSLLLGVYMMMDRSASSHTTVLVGGCRKVGLLLVAFVARAAA